MFWARSVLLATKYLWHRARPSYGRAEVDAVMLGSGPNQFGSYRITKNSAFPVYYRFLQRTGGEGQNAYNFLTQIARDLRFSPFERGDEVASRRIILLGFISKIDSDPQSSWKSRLLLYKGTNNLILRGVCQNRQIMGYKTMQKFNSCLLFMSHFSWQNTPYCFIFLGKNTKNRSFCDIFSKRCVF